MPNVKVMCTVENCEYWDHGNICVAGQILITHDKVGDKFPNRMDAPEVTAIVDQTGTTPAETCMDTCCKTFEHRKHA